MLNLELGVINLTQKSLDKSLFERAIFDTLSFLGAKGSFEISLVLVGEKRIRNLNRDFRKKDKVTDVLSFAFSEDSIEKNKKDSFVNMGEILICVPVAIRQAKKKNFSLEKELTLLSSHGAIHLFGIDHERSDEESKKTDEIQKKILNNFK